jgi:putative addiction module CopG family antidote
MAIEIPTDYHELIAGMVADGTYHSEEDVVRAALELLAERRRHERENFERLRAMAAEGLADIEAGRVTRVSAEDIKRMARERYLA